MIGILGGMGTQAGLDFCNKLAILYRGKFDHDQISLYIRLLTYYKNQDLLEFPFHLKYQSYINYIFLFVVEQFIGYKNKSILKLRTENDYSQ